MKTITMPIEEYEVLIKAKDELKKLPTVILYVNNSVYFSATNRVAYLNKEDIANEIYNMSVSIADFGNALTEAKHDLERAKEALDKVKEMSIYEFIKYRRHIYDKK